MLALQTSSMYTSVCVCVPVRLCVGVQHPSAETYVIVETSWLEEELGLRVFELLHDDLGLFWLLWNQTHNDLGVGGIGLISVDDLQLFWQKPWQKKKKDGVSVLLTWLIAVCFSLPSSCKFVASGRILTFLGVFLHVHGHLGVFEFRRVVVYVGNFDVKRQLLVQFLLGDFVKDVKLDLLRQPYIKSLPTMQSVGNTSSGNHTSTKLAYVEGLLVLFSVKRSMGEDFSRLGIYGEHVYRVLIDSVTAYAELVFWLLKVVVHLVQAQKSTHWLLQICSWMCTKLELLPLKWLWGMVRDLPLAAQRWSKPTVFCCAPRASAETAVKVNHTRTHFCLIV